MLGLLGTGLAKESKGKKKKGAHRDMRAEDFIKMRPGSAESKNKLSNHGMSQLGSENGMGTKSDPWLKSCKRLKADIAKDEFHQHETYT